MKTKRRKTKRWRMYIIKEYLPSIVRVGQFCIIGKHIIFFLLHFYIPGLDGGHAGLAGYRKGTFAWLLINLPWWISEPVAYFQYRASQACFSAHWREMHPICVCPAP